MPRCTPAVWTLSLCDGPALQDLRQEGGKARAQRLPRTTSKYGLQGNCDKQEQPRKQEEQERMAGEPSGGKYAADNALSVVDTDIPLPGCVGPPDSKRTTAYLNSAESVSVLAAVGLRRLKNLTSPSTHHHTCQYTHLKH